MIRSGYKLIDDYVFENFESCLAVLAKQPLFLDNQTFFPLSNAVIRTNNSISYKINNLNIRFQPIRFPPKRYKKIAKFKRWIGCLSWDTVIIEDKPLKIRGYEYNYHNLFHYEISLLERIQMGDDLVSGIHGFYSPMFHEQVIEPEYEGILDEARLTLHEWMTRTSLFSTLKAFNWMISLALMEINPITVIIRHGKSIKNYQGKMFFDFDDKNNYNLYQLLSRVGLV